MKLTPSLGITQGGEGLHDDNAISSMMALGGPAK